MGGILAESKVKISMTDLDKLDQHIDSSGRKFIGTTDRMSTSLKAMGGLFATIGVAKFGTDIFNASVQMDKLHRMLVNVEGSQEAANKRFEQFRILAKEPVLDPFNLSRFYTGLRAMNVEGDLSIRFMKGLANVMAGAGAGNEDFSRSMQQVVQMMGKGKLEGQDLRVILESFPQFAKYVKDALGSIDTEKLAKSGITATEVMQKLTVEFEKQPKFAGSAQEAVDNFKQALTLFESSVGQNVLPTISKFLNSLTDMLDRFQKLDGPLKTLIGASIVGGGGILGIAFAVNTLNESLKILGVSAGLKALTGGALAGGAKAGLGTTAGGIAIGGSALGALGAVAGATAATAWAVREIYIAATQVNVVGPASTAGAKKEVSETRGALLKELGLYGETQQFSTGMNPGDMMKMSNLFKQAGLDMNRYSNPSLKLTFADVISSLKTSFGESKYINKPMNLTGLGGTGNAELSPEAQKALDKMGNGLIEAWLSFNTEHLESYASTEAGKYKLGQRTLTNTGTAGNLEFTYGGAIAPTIPMGANLQPATPAEIAMYNTLHRETYNVPGGVNGVSELEQRDQQRTYQVMVQYYSEQENLQGKATDFMNQYWADTEAGYIETSKLGHDVMNNWDDLVNDMKNGIDEVSLSWSQAVNMMVQGTDQMIYGFEDLLKRLGIDVPEGGAWGTFKNILGGVQDVMSIFSGGKAFAKGINSFAEGGSGIVTRPTLFRVGESGPESFNIQPLSHGGRPVGGDIHFHGDIVVPYAPDPQAAANMVYNATQLLKRQGRW